MSRIRTIKPEFWTSEQVMECSPLARLVFIGMWNFCDDNGVHPASCKTLKAEIFPGDDLTAADVQVLVNELLQQRLLAEFDAAGRLWWFVTGWHHQLINRPSKSRYPLPPRPAPLPKAAGPDADPDVPVIPAAHGTLAESSVSPPGAFTEPSAHSQRALMEPSMNPPGTRMASSMPPPGDLPECSLPEGKGKERKGKEGRGKGGSAVPARPARAPKLPLPTDFGLTPELRVWADQHGFGDLDRHLDAFRDKAQANGYQYSDWAAAFRNAVREDWAGLRKPAGSTPRADPPPAPAVSTLSRAGEQQLRNLEAWIQQAPLEAAPHETH